MRYCVRLLYQCILHEHVSGLLALYCLINVAYMHMWLGDAVVQRQGVGLVISRSRVQILLEATPRNNLGQVVYTYVPLSPSSITWYRPKGGDALRLGR